MRLKGFKATFYSLFLFLFVVSVLFYPFYYLLILITVWELHTWSMSVKVLFTCDKTDTVVYWVRLLQNCWNLNPMDIKKGVPGMDAISESLNLKFFPVCPDRIHELYMGRITLQDIDCTSFVHVDWVLHSLAWCLNSRGCWWYMQMLSIVVTA